MRIWKLCAAGIYFILYFQVVVSEVCRSCTGPCILDKCACTNSTGSYEISCAICQLRKRITDNEGVILSNEWDGVSKKGYSNLSQCSVLIESPVGTTIRLYVNEFMTECCWDFLHFHDGLSPFDRTIGVYGGLLIDDDIQLLKQDREMVSSSNSIYLVFRPDEFVNHDGFSISYRVDGCPNDCSGQGQCTGGVCVCNAGWQGDLCNTATCKCENGGQCKVGGCECPDGFTGDNCEIDTLFNWWSYRAASTSSPGGRASFGGALVDHTYWVFGGYHLDGTKVKMAKYDLLTNTWSKGTDSGPIDRDGHTLTAYKNYLIMFGGQMNYQITDELWKYDITSSQWHQLNPQHPLGEMYPAYARTSSMGHCAVLVNSTIYYIGGIDSKGVAIINIQTYDVETNVWKVIGHRKMTRHFYDADSRFLKFEDGRIYHGRYAPSCVLNPITDKITVFGGLNTTRIMGENEQYWIQSELETIKESTFVEYDFYMKHWSNLYKADTNTIPLVYLAAVGMVGRNLVVLGGAHLSKGSTQCYNTAPYILNLETGEGRELKSFRKLKQVGPFRMGQGSFTYNNSVYFFGGYNGKLHHDFIVYHFGVCEDHTNTTRCLSAREDFTECGWNETTSNCFTIPISDCGAVKCDEECVPGDGFDRRCHACQTRPDCVWDQHYPDTCRPTALVNATGFDDLFKCRNVPNNKPSRIQCSEYKLCEHCKGQCVWDVKNRRCGVNVENERQEVDCSAIRPCSAATSCSKCLGNEHMIRSCMWCQLDKLYPDGRREGQCLDTSTYHARYPYGQCVKWTMTYSSPICPAASCSAHRNCTLCQAEPECGWCDDGSGTGTGSCHSGTFYSPLVTNICPEKSWFYESCPLCQCNGHSNCTDNVHCDQCQGDTRGKNCDSCVDGYYGDATNKGLCKPCHCSEHSEPFCNNLSGRCKCNTMGVGGTGCDTCIKGYEGDPKKDGGTCFRLLNAGGFTHSTTVTTSKVNFMTKLNASITEDVMIEIVVTFSSSNYTEFNLNTTMFYLGNSYNTYNREKTIQRSWANTFKKSRYDWDLRAAELRLYLEFKNYRPGDVRTLRIEVHQASNQIDLKQFFIIFSSCIVILLLIFLLAWTAKIRYSQYRTQRNLEIQLQERALRPFKTHKVLFKDPNSPAPGRIFEVRPLGIEPLAEEKYGLSSYLLTMPGPKDINLAIVSGSFVTSLPYGKVISNPNVYFTAEV